MLFSIAFFSNLVTYINYNILHAYINDVTKYYGQAVVVFDLDKAGASTKDVLSFVEGPAERDARAEK